MNFWKNLLKEPVIGLAPMDGVTDAAYRLITKKYGNPDVMFTEFVSVDGLIYGGGKLLPALIYSETERPLVVQLFGKDPELFFKAVHIVCEFGFDGVDINMGCPSKNVANRGAGAGLIRNPDLAKEIILAAKRGIKSWVENGIEAAGLDKKTMRQIKQTKIEMLKDKTVSKIQKTGREEIPVSVKTRIGYDKINTVNWIKRLSEAEPCIISLHGRTFKQMYQGEANWDEISKAVQATDIPVLGNGDIENSNDAVQKIKTYGVAGVLIGRASYGNPWIFKNKMKVKKLEQNIEEREPSMEEKIEVVLEHAKLHWDLKGPKGFVQMRKNLAWYFKSFPGATEVRNRLVRVNNLLEVEEILSGLK